MTGQINEPRGVLKGKETLARLGGPGPSESFTRPDPAIPCQGARQQSLTPFRQTRIMLPQIIGLQIAGSIYLPGKCLKKRTVAC